ncbi:MAG: hypothetical protein Q9222_006918 [Ikaeria aurantiellina]
MRLRLGLLQDHTAIDKQIAREAAEAQAKKQRQEIPTVKTEAQTKADEVALAKEKDKGVEKAKQASKPRIRPLSEAKAIDAGANFASETFLLSVGIGLIVFERWWSSRKESNRREDVQDRITELEESEKSARRALVELEKEILRIRAIKGKAKSSQRILPREVWELEEREEQEMKSKAPGFFARFRRAPITQKDQTPPKAISEASQSQAQDVKKAEAVIVKPAESQAKLTTHDLSIPRAIASSKSSDDQQQSATQQQQLFLLLTPESILERDRNALLSRIERLVSLTAAPIPAIAFLCSISPAQKSSTNGLQAYMTLQTMLHESSLSIALLPVASPTQILSILSAHIKPSVPAKPTSVAAPPRALLRQVTATAPNRPLSEHATNVLSDICHSIGEVAALTKNERGIKTLENFLGEEDAGNIASFWAEEWICE